MCACLLSRFSHVRLFATPWTVAHQAPLSLGFSSKNTGVSCHFLLQGSSQPRDRSRLFCIAGRFFTIWATSEASTMERDDHKETFRPVVMIPWMRLLASTHGTLSLEKNVYFTIWLLLILKRIRIHTIFLLTDDSRKRKWICKVRMQVSNCLWMAPWGQNQGVTEGSQNRGSHTPPTRSTHTTHTLTTHIPPHTLHIPNSHTHNTHSTHPTHTHHTLPQTHTPHTHTSCHTMTVSLVQEIEYLYWYKNRMKETNIEINKVNTLLLYCKSLSFERLKAWVTYFKRKKKKWRDKVFSFHGEIRHSGVKEVKDFQGNIEICPWERGLYLYLSLYTGPINMCVGG